MTVLLNIVLSLLWLPSLGARGLLLANSLSQSLQAILLLALVWRLVNGFNLKTLVISGVKIALSALVMVGTLHWIHALNATPDASLAARAWYLFGQLSISGLVFVAAARILRVEEIDIVWNLLLEKFARNVPTPPENREAPIA